MKVIESTPEFEATPAHQRTMELEESLLKRQKQLKLLDSEVSRIEEERKKVEAEIQLLVARNDELAQAKDSAVAEMRVANREGFKELGELKGKHREREQVMDSDGCDSKSFIVLLDHCEVMSRVRPKLQEMKVTKKFQWKIPNFSKLNVSQLYSNTFNLGGCRWKVRTNPKRYHLPDYFPLFLLCCSDPEVKLEVGCGRGRPRTIQAKYSFTLFDQVNGRSFTKRGGKQNFEIGGKLRGFESFIHYKHLFNPIEGFIVDDTIVIEARVSTYNNVASPVNVTKINEFGKCYRIVATEVEWKVSGVSKYEAVKSDNFLAGGCE
ncbi:Ubiquitin C-terminal hydrolase 12 [Linum grandiflorum]